MFIGNKRLDDSGRGREVDCLARAVSVHPPDSRPNVSKTSADFFCNLANLSVGLTMSLCVACCSALVWS